MLGKTWHDTYKEMLSSGEVIADTVASFVGSWGFICLHFVFFGFWILLPVEPFPFGLLTLIMSLEAILLSTLILMSQNRQAKRDEARSEADYRTDVEAKKEIEGLETRLARIEEEKIEKILKLLEEK